MNPYLQYQNTFHSKEAKQLEQLINSIDFNSLGISEYNIRYIENMKPTLLYFFQMYDYTLQQLIGDKHIDEDWIIDFGGGHGFLSLYLKLKGFRVIYCDYNPNSTYTIQKISEKIDFGPDLYVTGTTQQLLELVKEKNIVVNYLISTDTIEHVYDLDEMMKDLIQLNPSIQLIFTTASNPKNFLKSAALRKIMIKDEKEDFLPKRTQFIQQKFPQFNQEIIHLLAVKSRGLRFQDLEEFVGYYQQSNEFKKSFIDQYNCCDPEFGSWTERILPLKDYINLGKKYNFKTDFKNGFYCSIDKNGFKKIIVNSLNYINLKTKSIGMMFSPFITIKYSK